MQSVGLQVELCAQFWARCIQSVTDEEEDVDIGKGWQIVLPEQQLKGLKVLFYFIFLEGESPQANKRGLIKYLRICYMRALDIINITCLFYRQV